MSNRIKEVRQCERCGTDFRPWWGQPGRFCTVACKNKSRYTGRFYRGEGKGRNHRMIAERALGRPLPKGAEVHHWNMDKTNNRNLNLVICQDTAYHNLLHARMKVRIRRWRSSARALPSWWAPN